MYPFNVHFILPDRKCSLSRQLTCCLHGRWYFNERKFRKCIKGLNSEAERFESLELHTLRLWALNCRSRETKKNQKFRFTHKRPLWLVKEGYSTPFCSKQIDKDSKNTSSNLLNVYIFVRKSKSWWGTLLSRGVIIYRIEHTFSAVVKNTLQVFLLRS